MKKTSHPLRLASLGFALALPLALNAAPPTEPPEGKPGCHHPFPDKPFDAEHLPPHLNALSLTDTQRRQIGDLFKTQDAGLREGFEAVKKAHDALRQLSQSAEYTEEKAKALADSVTKTLSESTLAHAKLDHAIYELLTPTQQQQLKAWDERKEPHVPPR